MEKTDFLSFCKNIQTKFPDLRNRSFWDEWDWSNNSCEKSMIISAIAEEMILWAEENQWEKVRDMLDNIEFAFKQADNVVVAFLGTDFTVTILECKNKSIRETIKKMMGPETIGSYQMNLGGYNEA